MTLSNCGKTLRLDSLVTQSCLTADATLSRDRSDNEQSAAKGVDHLKRMRLNGSGRFSPSAALSDEVTA